MAESPRAGAPLLEGEGLRVRRGGHLVLDVERVTLRSGVTHAVLGPNGAGKSTLLRVLNGLEAADGRLRFAGREVRSQRDRVALRRATAAVFQKPYLLADSVRGNVESGLKLRGLRGEELARRAAVAMELLSIDHLAARSREGLSGGEAQRVSIARALAVEPQVLFLDEPMASLDPPTRRALLSDLEAIFVHRPITVVWVTHDRDEALSVADEVTFLSDGRVIQSGSALQVFARPATAEMADFLGVEAYIEGVVEVDGSGPCRLRLPGGATVVCGDAPSGPALACIYPEDVVLFTRPPDADSTSLRNVVEGRVADIQPVGRLRRVIVACEDFELIAAVTQAALDDLSLSCGDTVVAAFKATAVHVLPRQGHDEEGAGAWV